LICFSHPLFYYFDSQYNGAFYCPLPGVYMRKDSGAKDEMEKYSVYQCQIKGCEKETQETGCCDEHLDFSIEQDEDHPFQCRNEVKVNRYSMMFGDKKQTYCKGHLCKESYCERTRRVGACEKHVCCIKGCPNKISASEWVGVTKIHDNTACDHHMCDLCHNKPHLANSTRCGECKGRCKYYTAQCERMGSGARPFQAARGSYKAWCGRPVVPGQGHCLDHQCRHQRGLVRCTKIMEYGMQFYCWDHQKSSMPQPWQRQEEARSIMEKVLKEIQEDVAFWPGKQKAKEVEEQFHALQSKIVI